MPRTDRQTDYFKGDDNEHLDWLHDILVTYAVFHQDVGYAQGMNDVLSMILFVMDNEVHCRGARSVGVSSSPSFSPVLPRRPHRPHPSRPFTLFLPSKADAYWCFAKYMETIQADFMAHGMVRKIGRLVGARRPGGAHPPPFRPAPCFPLHSAPPPSATEELRDLMDFMEPALMEHLRAVDAGDLVFCHRWDDGVGQGGATQKAARKADLLYARVAHA